MKVMWLKPGAEIMSSMAQLFFDRGGRIFMSKTALWCSTSVKIVQYILVDTV